MSWICAQIGAREHYAIPRALLRERDLGTLYTDFWAGQLTRKILPARGPLNSLTSRYHSDLASASVHSVNLRALAWEARLRLKSRGDENRYLGYCEIGQRFASVVRNDLKRRRNLSPKAIFFSYDTGALEIFEFLRERGIKCVLDQMDPNRFEVQIVCEEEKRWADWVAQPTTVPEEYFARREEEWALADRVVVNSDFSRRALIQQGVPEEKLMIVPLCYETGDARQKATPDQSDNEISNRRPLKVLFLGQVILRKGIQYLVEAAKLLRNQPVHFDVVGPIGITPDAVRSAPTNVTFHGRASRDQSEEWYRQADIFILPTLSDGFAITQIEAMAHGLPVIATPNCGEVVTDSIDGYIVPTGDVRMLAEAVTRYMEDPQLLNTHRQAALQKAGQFTLARLAGNLAALKTELYDGPSERGAN